MRSRIALFFTSSLVCLFLANEVCRYLLSHNLVSDGGIRGAVYYKQRVPHPFLGFITATKKENHPVWQNTTPQSSEEVFRVGIFGGSVAYFWSKYLQTEPGKSRLQEFITQNFASKKNIEIVDFADGAWYQPQSLIATLLYGHNLDLAISIEGANELQRGRQRDFPIEFPRGRFTQIFYSHTFSSHLNLLLIDLTVMSTEQLESWAQKGWLPHLNGVMSLSIKNLMRQRLFDLPKEVAEAKELSALWFQSSHEQARLFKQRNIPYLLFIQPFPCMTLPNNQRPDEHCTEYPENSISFLQESLTHFRQEAKSNKLPFVDLSNFYPMDRSIFFDDLHLTEEGEELFTQKIFTTLKKTLLKKEQPTVLSQSRQ